jgi:hypothetical protein
MHGSIPLTRRRPPARHRWLSIAAVTVLLASSFVPLTRARADDQGDGVLIPASQFRTLAPIENVVSGSMWTIMQGLGPIISPIPTDPNALAGFNESGPGLAGASGGGNASTGINQQVPARNPAPSFSRNVIITRQTGYAPFNTEPSIAVDPTDPSHLVLGTIDYNSPTAMATYVSFDGGETWTGPNSIKFFREDYAGAGDPVVTFDRDGTVYLSFISVGFEQFYIGTIASYNEVSSMAVTKSLDGGLTWSDPVSAARGVITTVSNVDSAGKERGTITFPFFDKEWITTGPSVDDPSKDVIYMTFTDFESTYGLIYSDEVPYLSAPATESTIRMVRSEDGGDTWSAPVAVSPTVLEALQASAPGEGTGASAGGEAASDSGLSGAGTSANTGDGSDTTQQEQQQSGNIISANRTVQGSQPKVLADGTLVTAYLDSTDDGAQEGLFTIQVNISKDGGKTFAGPVTAGIFREPHGQPRNTQFRYWGSAFPQLAVGPKGEIYIATTALPSDKPTDDGDIYLLRSLDSGKSWKEPLRINTDKTSHLQFFPSIAVSPDGTVNLMWGDMRDDPKELRYNVYYSRSQDQGATWGFNLPDQNFTAPDTRVSDFDSNSLKGFPGGAFIGDYFSLAATKGEVYMVWADTRLGEFSGYDQQIAFARQEAIKPAQLYLNPPSGSAGRIVQIQGFGFQPESNILLLVSGVIVSNERTDEKGQFQTSIYMPLTGEGPTNISAFDETGNAATAAFYTDFGFDTLQKELDQINSELQGGNGSPVASPVANAPTPVTPPPAVSSPTASASAAASVSPSPAVKSTGTATPTPAATSASGAKPTPTSAFGPLPTSAFGGPQPTAKTSPTASPSPTPTATRKP